jgi:phosphatidate cytidylyltransferase
MLKQRIITALLLLALLLPAIFHPRPEAFGIVATVLISAGAWEWAKLNQYGQFTALSAGGICALLCIASWVVGLLSAPLQVLWICVGGGWVLFSSWLLYAGVTTWGSVPRALRLILGIVALWSAWLAVSKARLIGINFLFSVLVLVWIADIFAYFCGRLWGGRIFPRKLAPSISPGKTWEGVLGGMLGALMCAFIWRSLDMSVASEQASIYTRLNSVHPLFMVVAVFFLAAMSVVGDLIESLIKRSAGVKDSSRLLPGHGGVLDRVDALLPVLPLAMMLTML